ncbi:MAG: type VI secretion system tip protein VgrG [Saprospiraceae bacterium]|nr:type VI secretion system tip protein VgrG [Saprospiraceae bacterium]
MANSPITSESDLTTFTVLSNGSVIKDTTQVLSIYIDNKINKVPYCEMELADGSVAKEDFPISDSDTFVPGAEIEVKVGYENNNTSVFKGIVVKHSIEISPSRGPVLKILIKDKSVKMTIGRKNTYYQETTDSDIINKLIANNGLSADVTSTSNELEKVIQYYSTDWDFMISRAQVNGLVVFAKDGKVSVKNPNKATDEVLSLTFGLDILEFDGEIDAEYQFNSIKSSAWNPQDQVVSSETATPSDSKTGNLSTEQLSKVIGLENYDLQTGGFITSEGLTSWAEAEATKSKYAKVRGSIKFQGNSLVMPGKLLNLKGLGKRFNGNAYVSGVIHDIRDGDWTTTACIGLSPNWFTEQVKTEVPMAGGLLPGIQGLQIAKVKQISEDPNGEFRVLINLPLIQTSDEGVWARLATFYATSGAGAFFYPEVDDEVVVGFFNNDPRFPVIIGSVYSNGRAAPETPDQGNSIKAFVSKSNMKITFDEEKKVITIITPGNNQMELNDEETSITISDQNNNSIKLSESGIDINSASSISITAEESITMTANASISGSAAGGNISLAGLSISASAETELSLSGAMVSMEAEAEMSLSAAMIMIN